MLYVSVFYIYSALEKLCCELKYFIKSKAERNNVGNTHLEILHRVCERVCVANKQANR